MVELKIEETGFPQDRPTLELFKDSFKIPIDGIIKHFAGSRILEGFEENDNGDGTITISAGLILFKGKVHTFSGYTGAPNPSGGFIFFYEQIGQFSFNVGSEEVPIYEDRDAFINRTAVFSGGQGTYLGKLFVTSLLKERLILEYYKSGRTILGNIIQRTDEPIYDIQFDAIPSDDYLVIGNFRPVDPAASFTAAFSWESKNKSKTGFDLVFNQVRAETPVNIPVYFDWILVATTRF